MLGVVNKPFKLSVFMLNVVMANVLAPYNDVSLKIRIPEF